MKSRPKGGIYQNLSCAMILDEMCEVFLVFARDAGISGGTSIHNRVVSSRVSHVIDGA